MPFVPVLDNPTWLYTVYRAPCGALLLEAVVTGVGWWSLWMFLSAEERALLDADPEGFRQWVLQVVRDRERPDLKARRLGALHPGPDGTVTLPQQVEAAYDRWAPTYDTSENRTRDLDAACLQTWCARTPLITVLELGCGTGKNTRWLVTQAQVTGLDVSRGMLAQAERAAPAATLVRTDLRRLWPVAEESVEAVLADLVLEHLPDLAHIADEAWRVLQPGGLLRISELHPLRQQAGARARFAVDGETVEVSSFVRSEAGLQAPFVRRGFVLTERGEHRAAGDTADRPPRLLVLVFRKGG